MLMPDRSPVGREDDRTDIHIVFLGKDRIEPDFASGGTVSLRRRRPGISSYDQHGFPFRLVTQLEYSVRNTWIISRETTA
jgi:hypothetical protein